MTEMAGGGAPGGWQRPICDLGGGHKGVCLITIHQAVLLLCGFLDLCFILH